MDNQPGALTGQLAADVPMLQNISGRRLGSMVEVLVLIVSSLFIGFYYSWEITLVALAYFPILMLAGAFEVRQLTLLCTPLNKQNTGMCALKSMHLG